MENKVVKMVAEKIMSELEKGRIPWVKPWCNPLATMDELAFNRVTKKPYSLLNQMLLAQGGEWATFKQWQELGGKVRKGEKSSFIVFWKMLDVERTNTKGEIMKDENGDPLKKQIPYLRYSSVFHISQVEGVEPLDLKIVNPDYKERPKAEPIPAAAALLTYYLNREKIELVNDKKDKAYYSPALDNINLPLISQFAGAPEYYSTAFHECTHSTGHETRLNRLTRSAAFGSQAYAKEELTAEIGAASILQWLGIASPMTEKNSAAYCQSWLKKLKDDPSLIVTAAGKAEKAVLFIVDGYTFPEGPEDDTTKKEDAEPVETPEPASKDVQSLVTYLHKDAVKHNFKYSEICIHDGVQLATNGHVLARFPGYVPGVPTMESDAMHKLEKGFSMADYKEDNIVDYREFYKAMKEFKTAYKAENGKNAKTILYTLKDGITVNADYLYRAMKATNADHIYTIGKKSPIMLTGEGCTVYILPVHCPDAVTVGFKAI